MRSPMFALRAAGAAVVLVALPVVGATSAQAHDSVRVTVTPATVAPGGEIRLRVDGCRSRTGTGTSPVFVAAARLSPREDGRNAPGRAHTPESREGSPDRAEGRQAPLSGTMSLKASIASGAYRIDVRCDGHRHSGSGVVQVVHERPGDQERPGHHEGPAPQERPSHHASPVAPVSAGGGGTAVLAADEREAEREGPAAVHAVVGLVLAGVAAVIVAYRSVRRQRASSRDSD